MKKITSLEAFINNVKDETEDKKNPLKAIEILLQQNAQLENEIKRLNYELDEVTLGVQKKGYLYKWREREIYYASKWGLRYIVLQGNKISYYGNEHEHHPRRTIDLTNCFVRDEGKKKSANTIYYVFSIYLGSLHDDYDTEQESSTGSSLLLRLSCNSSAEASLWIDMLEQGCALHASSQEFKSHDFINQHNIIENPLPLSLTSYQKCNEKDGLDALTSYPIITTTSGIKTKDNPKIDENEDFEFEIHTMEGALKEDDNEWIQADTLFKSNDNLLMLNDDELSSEFPTVMLQRVKSSTKVLQKSLSRQTFARHILSGRAPNDFTKSGTRLFQLEQKLHDDDTNKSKNTNIYPTISTATTTNTSIDQSRSNKLGYKSKPTRTFPAYKPMHIQCQSSPLSPDTGKGDHNFRGFFNLGVIILALSHVELIINNLTQVGLKVSWFQLPLPWDQNNNLSDKIDDIYSSPTFQYITLALGMWTTSITLSFVAEIIASKYQKVSEVVFFMLNALLIIFNIVIPCMIVWKSKLHVGANMIFLFQSVIIWMKLISYAHANSDLRIASKKNKRLDKSLSKQSLKLVRSDSISSVKSNDSQYDNNAKPYNEQMQMILAECKDLQPPFILYPQNITLINLLYFLIVPTLCYQLNYPRSANIRWSNVLFLILRLIFVGAMILFSVEQYIVTTLEAVVTPMENRNILRIMEKLLKLSIPNTYIWLLIFYFYFHLWLNLLAELTRFGDRQFYKEWWNSRTIDVYWRTWNMPVHHWVTRHLYYPLLHIGIPKAISTIFVFMFSAIMHEVVISIPFKYIALHAFFGMTLQAPLIFLTKYIDRRFDNAFIGNAMFWCIFCIVGQPMGIMMYYYDLCQLAKANTH